MTGLHRLKWILTPSLVSGPLALLAACCILGSAGWSYINDSQLFYSQLFGPLGVVTLLQIQPYNIAAFQGAIFNSSLTYYVMLVAGALIAGVSIYWILEGISHLVRGTSLFLREVHETRLAARQAAMNSLVRLGLQIACLVAWAIYWVVFAVIVVPFSIVVLQQSLDSISAGHVLGWVILPFLLAALSAAVHLHVTFLRLVFLRVRLLGGFDAELSRLESEHDEAA